MEVEVAVLGSLSLIIVFVVSVDVKQQRTVVSQELRSCVKVEVAVLIVFMVSVDVKQH